MSDTLVQIRELIARREVVISEHGYDELANDQILVADVLTGVTSALAVEDYPDHARGACVLVLQQDSAGAPIHVVWGIARDTSTPAVMVTAYRPDHDRWTEDFLRRK
jgi:hypothetical protein